jgi:hypothetical protein
MEILEYISRQVGVNRRYVDGTLQNLTDELVNWVPPGQANSIGATLLHFIGGEDRVVQTVLQSKPTIWETGDWAAKIGIPIYPMTPEAWKAVSAVQLTLPSILDYLQVVRAGTDAYLASATPQALDRTVNFVGADRPAGEALAMVLTHASHHIGEVAALKGVQGGLV